MQAPLLKISSIFFIFLMILQLSALVYISVDSTFMTIIEIEEEACHSNFEELIVTVFSFKSESLENQVCRHDNKIWLSLHYINIDTPPPKS